MARGAGNRREGAAMSPQTGSPYRPLTRCPHCRFPHDGQPGTICEVCQAKQNAGDSMIVTRQDAWAQHAETVHFPPPSPKNGAPHAEHEGVAVLTEAGPEACALPPAPPAPERPRRHRRGPRELRRCKYEPCSAPFVPRNDTQMFHTVQCGARWRVSQPAGQDQLRQASAAHKRQVVVNPPSFAAQARKHCARLEVAIAALTARIASQQALLQRQHRQRELLRQYVALEEGEEPSDTPA